MPIYEYLCHACGHQLETLQKMSDSPLTDCPNCGKNSLEKKISSTQFQLKGSGWYVTDFKDTGKSKKDTTTSSSNESSNAGSDKKSETKSSSSSSE